MAKAKAVDSGCAAPGMQCNNQICRLGVIPDREVNSMTELTQNARPAQRCSTIPRQ
jgi:hypothetical protein